MIYFNPESVRLGQRLNPCPFQRPVPVRNFVDFVWAQREIGEAEQNEKRARSWAARIMLQNGGNDDQGK